eukprot:COSAG04_NODE_14691_length_559_cov_0.550000_1_plen_35_part_01
MAPTAPQKVAKKAFFVSTCLDPAPMRGAERRRLGA